MVFNSPTNTDAATYRNLTTADGFTFPMEIRQMKLAPNTGSGPDFRSEALKVDRKSHLRYNCYCYWSDTQLTFESPNPDLKYFQTW